MGSSKQSGSSLVEVMVALFVLAIGLLGVLAMQSKSMKFNQSANSYSNAVYLANSLAERIAMNPSVLAGYIDAANASTNCNDNACSPAQLAEWDQKQWDDSIAALLPAGSGAVTQVTNNGMTYAQITVSFDDSRADERDPGKAVDGTVDTSYTGRRNYTLLVGL